MGAFGISKEVPGFNSRKGCLPIVKFVVSAAAAWCHVVISEIHYIDLEAR